MIRRPPRSTQGSLSLSLSLFLSPFTPAPHHHPPPLQYDAMGKRTNTRTYRLRERLIHQRHDWCVHVGCISSLPIGKFHIFNRDGNIILKQIGLKII
jgi:hypothetical protein